MTTNSPHSTFVTVNGTIKGHFTPPWRCVNMATVAWYLQCLHYNYRNFCTSVCEGGEGWKKVSTSLLLCTLHLYRYENVELRTCKDYGGVRHGCVLFFKSGTWEAYFSQRGAHCACQLHRASATKGIYNRHRPVVTEPTQHSANPRDTHLRGTFCNRAAGLHSFRWGYLCCTTSCLVSLHQLNSTHTWFMRSCGARWGRCQFYF